MMPWLKPIFYIVMVPVLSTPAIAIFTTLFLQRLEYYNHYQLEEGIFVGSFFLIIFALLSAWPIRRYGHLLRVKLLSFALYLYLLAFIFFNIAFSLRDEFGATWTQSEVWNELVFYQWQTYALIAVTGLFYLWLNHWYAQTKKTPYNATSNL